MCTFLYCYKINCPRNYLNKKHLKIQENKLLRYMSLGIGGRVDGLHMNKIVQKIPDEAIEYARGWAFANTKFRGKIIIIYVITLFVQVEPLLNLSFVGVKLLLLLLCILFCVHFTGNILLICSLFWRAVFHRWFSSCNMYFAFVCVRVLFIVGFVSLFVAFGFSLVLLFLFLAINFVVHVHGRKKKLTRLYDEK